MSDANTIDLDGDLEDELFVEVDSGVALVTLDAPTRRNALTHNLVAHLCAAIDALEEDPNVRAIVITGAPPAFCAGADVGHLAALGPDTSLEEREDGVRSLYQGFLRVSDCKLPTIAAVNGAAVGAGLNLALACDIRLAGASARFDPGFLKLGIHQGGGNSWLLQRLVGPQAAAAMILFGEALDGPTAERLGLVWRCVADDALLDEATHLAAKAASVADAELGRTMKQTLRAMSGVHTHADAVDHEIGPQLWSMGLPSFAERINGLR